MIMQQYYEYKMRLWCAANGWTDFGPYGGVPSEEEGDGGDDLGARDELRSCFFPLRLISMQAFTL